MSPYDRVMENERLARANLAARLEKAKAEIKYAEIQVSNRKYRLIEWDGCSFVGNDMNPKPRFKFVTRNMNVSELFDCWQWIYEGKGIPEMYSCSSDD